MSRLRAVALPVLLALGVLQGCSGGRTCQQDYEADYRTDGARPNLKPCSRECLDPDLYYKCKCKSSCPCWDSHPH
jgi:hypothetical protein